MTKIKKNEIKYISRKKEIRQQLISQLATSLPGLKEILGDKKFESRIKKAAKLLSEGIKQKPSKKIKHEKKKVTKKKAVTSELTEGK
ncbi:MAG: hypothetical protein ABI675_07170 [Chitinophagaceae bacterium]